MACFLFLKHPLIRPFALLPTYCLLMAMTDPYISWFSYIKRFFLWFYKKCCKSHKKTPVPGSKKVTSERPATLLKKEALTQVLSCEFYEIFWNSFFTEDLWATTSDCYSSIFVCSGVCVIPPSGHHLLKSLTLSHICPEGGLVNNYFKAKLFPPS